MNPFISHILMTKPQPFLLIYKTLITIYYIIHYLFLLFLADLIIQFLLFFSFLNHLSDLASKHFIQPNLQPHQPHYTNPFKKIANNILFLFLNIVFITIHQFLYQNSFLIIIKTIITLFLFLQHLITQHLTFIGRNLL